MKLKFRVINKTLGTVSFVEGIFNERPFTETSSFPQYESCHKEHDIEVDQWTGKKDKDGDEIYNRDKIEVDCGTYKVIGVVGFCEGSFIFENEILPGSWDIKIVKRPYEE